MPRHIDDLLPTRTSLLNRLKNWRDESSWEEFFEIYWRLIYEVARKAGLTDAEAQDVVQATMLSVAKHMPTFKYDPALGSFKSWLLKLTHWRIIDQFRLRGPLAPEDAQFAATNSAVSEDLIPVASNDFEKLWEAEWKENLLQAAVAKVKRRLDPLQYQLFDFYVQKGWPPKKVAAAFALSIRQVYAAKHQVTLLIKKELTRLEKEVT